MARLLQGYQLSVRLPVAADELEQRLMMDGITVEAGCDSGGTHTRGCTTLSVMCKCCVPSYVTPNPGRG